MPGWDNNARLHIKAVVSFSGVTDPSNWDHPGLDDDEYEDGFERAVSRYVHLDLYPDPEYDYTTLRAAAPLKLILDDGVTSSPPVRLYASEFDTVSYTQAEEMRDALQGIGLVSYTFFEDSYNHAYDNWHEIDPLTDNCVSDDVIAFFQNYP